MSTGRQLVPGLLLMPDGARTNSPGTANFGNHANPSMVKRAAANQNTNAASAQTTAAIAKELLDTGETKDAGMRRKLRKILQYCKSFLKIFQALEILTTKGPASNGFENESCCHSGSLHNVIHPSVPVAGFSL